jgi:hypothetical protein
MSLREVTGLSVEVFDLNKATCQQCQQHDHCAEKVPQFHDTTPIPFRIGTAKQRSPRR